MNETLLFHTILFTYYFVLPLRKFQLENCQTLIILCLYLDHHLTFHITYYADWV